MEFETNERARYRAINDTGIKWRIKSENSTIIYNNHAQKMTRLFNAIPGNIRDITGVETEQFKIELE